MCKYQPQNPLSSIDPKVIDDSIIYGDKDDNHAEVIETMTIYNPDADRYEDVDELTQEHVHCHAYSRKTGKEIKNLSIHDIDSIRHSLDDDNQFIWAGVGRTKCDDLRRGSTSVWIT